MYIYIYTYKFKQLRLFKVAFTYTSVIHCVQYNGFEIKKRIDSGVWGRCKPPK